ncbi:Serine/threonine-protein kinase SRPK [Colletotrichum orbiculare MAFF 240422]|uniref:EKC/KEOPS complex subunit BUD32 n=1 Tax=Colletotrichum orbiculare (strain 104-T / ATCC 96160 / CBS 514.97 / LARS 414 / MAFF 240422) TaxID=1213857 RepID=N4V359_COLOR|nr:Serine/threonine-protein kinase SRPK [Colletotrichum orbiculare MAFF 240422]
MPSQSEPNPQQDASMDSSMPPIKKSGLEALWKQPIESKTIDWTTITTPSFEAKFPGCDFRKVWMQEDEEAHEDYCAGGYHPVQLGDKFANNRYTIVHKLGFGGYSTVWLAFDEEKKTYVSLKIAVSDPGKDKREAEDEISILAQLLATDSKHPGKSSIANPPLDSFVHDGVNGKHQCTVSTLHRVSLAVSKESADGAFLFEPQTARAMIAQLILAVAYMHSNGVVHGDITLSNIFLPPPNLSDIASHKDLFKKFQPAGPQPLVQDDGEPYGPEKPPYMMPSFWFGGACDELEFKDAWVTLGDFGEAWKPAERSRFKLHTPVLYLAPEAVFAEEEQVPISFTSDIWALGMVIYSLYASGSLLEVVSDEEGMLDEVTNMLGAAPRRFRDLEEGGRRFTEKHAILKVPREIFGLDRRVHEWVAADWEDELAEEEIDDLYELLRGIFKWQPKHRVTAEGLVRSRWMRKWGIPALEDLCETREGGDGYLAMVRDVAEPRGVLNSLMARFKKLVLLA